MANDVCIQLGFASGTVYTFGVTQLLPTLPIVAGFSTCAGGEPDIFSCAESGAQIADRNCEMGCTGFDGIPGTSDDVSDTHATEDCVWSQEPSLTVRRTLFPDNRPALCARDRPGRDL